VEDKHTGFLVDSESPSQIAEKILLLMKNKALAEKLGQNGYEKLKKEFSLEAMGKHFLKLYSSIVVQ
jgi:glycosyltransferase involved in cell wall biosynthesis